MSKNLWGFRLQRLRNALIFDRVPGEVACAICVNFHVAECPIEAPAAAVIIAHNHPSGDPAPSPEDVSITRKIVEAGKLLDISVLDHLVIGNGRFVSLKERGLGFD